MKCTNALAFSVSESGGRARLPSASRCALTATDRLSSNGTTTVTNAWAMVFLPRLGVEFDAQVCGHQADRLHLAVPTRGAAEPALFQQRLEGLRDLRSRKKRPDAPVQPVAEQHVLVVPAIRTELLRFDDPALAEHGR